MTDRIGCLHCTIANQAAIRLGGGADLREILNDIINAWAELVACDPDDAARRRYLDGVTRELSALVDAKVAEKLADNPAYVQATADAGGSRA